MPDFQRVKNAMFSRNWILSKSPSIQYCRALFIWRSALCVGAYGGEGLIAQVVLDPAGVLAGDILIDAEPDKKLRQQPVPLIYPPGYLHARAGQSDVRIIVHGDVAVFTQPLCCIADARLCNSELSGDIDRPASSAWLQDNPRRIFVFSYMLTVF